MKYNNVLVVADDLSGAADCALGFVQAGMEATVLLDQEADAARTGVFTQVVSVDADTRGMDPAAAAQVQRAIIGRYLAPGRLLYKKIDSTLRGNVAAELAPAIADIGMAIIAPAFPSLGRTTRSGQQFVHGVPLAQTAIWRSGLRTGSAHLPALLAAGGIGCAVLSVDTVRQPLPVLHAYFVDVIRSGTQAVVCDAETDDDLYRIVQASIALTEPVFWVGSAGLSHQIARTIRPAGAAAVPLAPDNVQGAIVTVVGSFADVSRRQAAFLAASRPLTRVTVSTDVLRHRAAHVAWQRLQQDLLHVVRDAGDVLLTIDETDPVSTAGGLALCQALAALVAPCAGAIGALVLTGGETARAVLSALNVQALTPLRQIESGVPLSRTYGDAAIPVITKAGAFGSDAALVRCYDTLCQARTQTGRADR